MDLSKFTVTSQVFSRHKGIYTDSQSFTERFPGGTLISIGTSYLDTDEKFLKLFNHRLNYLLPISDCMYIGNCEFTTVNETNNCDQGFHINWATDLRKEDGAFDGDFIIVVRIYKPITN